MNQIFCFRTFFIHNINAKICKSYTNVEKVTHISKKILKFVKSYTNV